MRGNFSSPRIILVYTTCINHLSKASNDITRITGACLRLVLSVPGFSIKTGLSSMEIPRFLSHMNTKWSWNCLILIQIILVHIRLHSTLKQVPVFYIGWGPGPHLNIKTVFPRYVDYHVKDKTAVRPSYLWHGDPYTGKMTSLYWVAPLIIRKVTFMTSIIYAPYLLISYQLGRYCYITFLLVSLDQGWSLIHEDESPLQQKCYSHKTLHRDLGWKS